MRSMPSGKFLIRLPQEMHRRLREISRLKGASLNELCKAKLGELTETPTFLDRRSSQIPEGWQRWVAESFPEAIGTVLFGSVARGEENASSDVDLLLVLPTEAEISRSTYGRWENAMRKAGPLSNPIEKVSPHFVRLPEDPATVGGLWFEVALDGIVVADTDNRVARALFRIRNWMATGKIRRRFSHGHPYWVKEIDGAE